MFFQFFNRSSLSEISVFHKSENYRKHSENFEKMKFHFLKFVRQTLSFTKIAILFKSAYSMKSYIKNSPGIHAYGLGLKIHFGILKQEVAALQKKLSLKFILIFAISRRFFIQTKFYTKRLTPTI